MDSRRVEFHRDDGGERCCGVDKLTGVESRGVELSVDGLRRRKGKGSRRGNGIGSSD